MSAGGCGVQHIEGTIFFVDFTDKNDVTFRREIRHKAISYAFFLFFMNSYGRLQGVSLRFSMLYNDYIETFRQIIHFHVFTRKICDLPRVALYIKKYNGNH